MNHLNKALYKSISHIEASEYERMGEELQRMNESSLLHEGCNGQLYVVDFKKKKLIGKNKKALAKITPLCYNEL